MLRAWTKGTIFLGLILLPIIVAQDHIDKRLFFVGYTVMALALGFRLDLADRYEELINERSNDNHDD